MRYFSRFIVFSLCLTARAGVAAPTQHGTKPAENGGKMLRKEGKVSAKMLREDERAERIATVRTDSRMTRKPALIREEDRLAHRKQPRPQTTPATPKRRHTTL